MPIFVKASRRAKAYTRSGVSFKRTDTEKLLKARHDAHQKLIKYKPGADISAIHSEKDWQKSLARRTKRLAKR